MNASKQKEELRKSNNQLDKQISKENAPIINDMTIYLRVSRISELQMEQIRQDLLEMTIAAQQRGESLESVIGSDYKAFCDEIIANAGPKPFIETVKESVYIIAMAILTLLIIDVIFSGFPARLLKEGLGGNADFDYNIPITLGFVSSTVAITLVAWLLVVWVGKKAFALSRSAEELRTKPKSVTYPKRILWGLLIGAAVAGFFILTISFKEIVLFSVHALLLVAIAVGLYLVTRWAK